MSEEKKEIFVPVPLHVVQKEARYSRTMKQILGKFAKENKLAGSNKVFEVSTDHNKAYELAEKKKKVEADQKEIEKVEADVEPVKAKNATDNKKRS